MKMEISGLLNRTANLYNNKLFSDVEYRVKGTDGQFQIFYAHKLILAMAGEGFAKIFYDSKLEQSACLKITDFTPHVFDLMLKYIYTDKIKLPDLETAMNVFQLAVCFSVRDLMKYCNTFLNQYQVNHDSVFAKYHCALIFKDGPLIYTYRKLVSKDTEAVFGSPFFCMASRSVIEDILKLDKFNLPSELEVIEATLKWCKADCKRRYGSTKYLYVRHSFLHFCGNLRFLTLDIQDFLDFVDNHELLLTKHEIEQFTASLFSENDQRPLIPKGFSEISKRLRCVKLKDSSLTIGSGNRLDTRQEKSDGLYSYTNGDTHLMNASPNHNQSSSHFPVSNGTNNVNQTLNDTAKKSIPILSFTAQSNGHGNLVKTRPNYTQASYPLQSSGPNGFMKTGPNNNSSLSVSQPVIGFNSFKQSRTPLSNGPTRQVNGHSNSKNGKVLVPARSTRVVPQPATKNLIMSYEFQLHEMQKQISSSCESDIKCHLVIEMLKGTILIHGIELKVKASNKTSDEEDIEVFLCIANKNKDEYNMSYPLKIRPNNDLLQLPFADPITVSPTNPVDIEVMIDDLKMSRCGVCRAHESMCQLNSGLNVTAQIELRSNQSNGNNFVFLISKILYSVPRY